MKEMALRLAQFSTRVLLTNDRRDLVKLARSIKDHLRAKLEMMVTRFPDEPIMLSLMSDGWSAAINDKVSAPVWEEKN